MPPKNIGLRGICSEIQKGRSRPALSLVKTNPEYAAAMSKLVRNNLADSNFDTNDKRTFFKINQSRMQEISTQMQRQQVDAENMLQLFPEVELSAQILISSILSPKDMVNTELIYQAPKSVFPADLSMKITEIIKTAMENEYAIKNDIQHILRAALFETGSYIKAIIPESSLDEFINGKSPALESIASGLIKNPDNKRNFNTVTSKGILGNKSSNDKTSFSLEAFSPYNNNTSKQNYDGIIDEVSGDTIGRVEVTDNYELLKFPLALEANAEMTLKNITRCTAAKSDKEVIATESNVKNMSNSEFASIAYKKSSRLASPFRALKPSSSTQRRSVGRPLVMRLPSEAVIPVHVPSDPSRHIGYFLLVDEVGNPITKQAAQRHINNSTNMLMNESNSLSSTLLQRARNNLENTAQGPGKLSLDQAADLYAGIIESDLIDRLKNGIYNSKLSLSRNNDVYQIMLARSLANEFTRLVFIPAEMVSYYSYRFHPNGIGKSLLDELSVLFGLRGILLFARVMASAKNSINITHVDMEIDPDDPDPQKTIEMATNEIMKMRQQYFPLGLNSPADLVDWVQRAGFEFTFSGHPGLPQTKFNFENKQMQHVVPDDALDETLRKQTIMMLGLTPEIVDNGFASEFATTVVANNILLSKRVMQIQEAITPILSADVRRHVFADSIIYQEIKSAVTAGIDTIDLYLDDQDKAYKAQNREGFITEMIERFISGLEITLPRPDTTTIQSLAASFDAYKEALENAINTYISSDIITSEISGDISNNIDTIKNILMAYFLRRWMAENGYMTELSEIITADDDGAPMIELYGVASEHLTGVIRTAIKFIDQMGTIREAANKDLEKMGAVEGSDTSDSGADDSGSDSSSGDDFGMGDDDFDTGVGTDDNGTGSETSGDETTADEPTDEKPEDETKPAEDKETPTE